MRCSRRDLAIGSQCRPARSSAVNVTSAADHPGGRRRAADTCRRKPRIDAFPDPDRFVFDRPNRQHVALGHGLHYCLGVPLARLEGRIALQTVFERWPTIRQAGELVYADNFNVRMLRSLPVATS